MTSLTTLLKEPPLLHEDPQGSPVSWQPSDKLLHFIDKKITANSKTLETGAGISTILFATKSCNHTCIVPDPEQVNRIKEYCANNNISSENITFKIEVSEKVLPSLDINELDLVLIDGSHAFPIPFIDWYYTCHKLKVGGTLIVDDTQIWTGEVLKQFLIQEPEWELQSKESTPRSAIFTKTRPYNTSKGFLEQSYVYRKTKPLTLLAEIKNGWQLLSTGNFKRLSHGVTRRIKGLFV